jgi:hypothetical protein
MEKSAFRILPASGNDEMRPVYQPNFINIHFGYYIILTSPHEEWQFNIFINPISNALGERAFGRLRGGIKG